MPPISGSTTNPAKQMNQSASVPNISTVTIPKMKKLSEPDQGCFMVISEQCHPGLRLGFPNSAKILAGLAGWIVNRLMQSDAIVDGLQSIFGETEMFSHAVQNVGNVARATEYPGNLFILVPYVPTDDKIVAFQITITVEYVITEILALAGGHVERLKDQPQFKSQKREKYEDFPQIRPSDIRLAVNMDEDLKTCFGGLFKMDSERK